MRSALSLASKSFRRFFSAFCLLSLAFGLEPVWAWANDAGSSPAPERERINLDRDWRFAFGHATDSSKDFGYGTRPFFFAKAGYGDGPAATTFSDAAWRTLDLPHDWAVELPFDPRGDGNHGSKAIGRNFPENSVGWYRKQIVIPKADENRRISLTFDGVYRNSVVWFNGHYIGTEPSGYSSFSYDVTDYVNFGGPNLIAVRVDATVEEGWFYEGAGIYRHVWLNKTHPLHIAQWSTFVRSSVEGTDAKVSVNTTVVNQFADQQTFAIEATVYAPNGTEVSTQVTEEHTLEPEASREVAASFTVPRATLWDITNSKLYRLVVTIRSHGTSVDQWETPFGIRTVSFDPKQGFFLNGRRVELKGIDNHQDFAGVGVAAPDALLTWRLQRLKEIGVNALRMSHNPPTPELLDAADRLGFLVIDEHRMMGTTPEIRSQLERLIKRDRNHPSVILWSVGNEEWALEWTELGTRLTERMQTIVHRFDPTRRTTAAVSGSGQGVSIADVVVGFNYHTQHDIDAFHQRFPEKPAVMTEEGSTTATRGIYFDDRAHVHLAAYDRPARPGLSSSIEEAWKFVQARPFIGGMFVWTGFDYRGETTPFGWPAISSQFGMLDTTGIIKDTGYYLQSVWTEAPMVHLLPHWNWAGREGELISVWAYSNTHDVELLLNGRSLGIKPVPTDGHVSWQVPYASGTLTAKAYRDGHVVTQTEVSTTGNPATVRLSADRKALAADGKDVSVLTVNVTDDSGRVVPTADNEVSFQITGPWRIIGVGNGDPGSHEADRTAERYFYSTLGHWHSQAVDRMNNLPEVAENVDSSLWRNPFQWLPPEKQPPETKAVVLRGDFSAPKIEVGQNAEIFVAALAPNETIYLNGAKQSPERRDGHFVLPLLSAELKPNNSLCLVLETPKGGVAKLADASQGGVNWATVRVESPAALWQRRVFGGYAQVLVQSTGEAGKGTLSAQSSGLKSDSITIDVR